MEIANLMQPLGMDPSAGVAVATGQPASTSPAPEGAFALFFAQMMNPATAVSPELIQRTLLGENADKPEEEQSLQQAEPAEKQSVMPADLTAELQTLALLSSAPVVPAQLSPVLPEENAQVEVVSAPVVPEATLQATATPVIVSKPVAEGDRSQNPIAAQSASVQVQARPAAETAAPETAERGQAETAVLSAQKEQASIVRRVDVPASPAWETEVSPKPVATTVNSPAPIADEASASEPITVAAKAVPAQEAGLTLRQAAAAEDQATEPAAVIEEAGEAVAPTDETRIKGAVREAGFSSPANYEQAEQHLAQQGKEMPAQPAAVATEANRATEAVRQSSAPTPAEPTAPEHEHIMHQVKEKLAVHSFKGGNNQISFTLHPEELGELKIMMRMNDQRLLKVEIVAQNQTVREALMQNLEGLKETLSRQNITVDRFDVNTGGGTFNQAFHEGRHTGRDRYFQPYTRFTGGTNEPEQKGIVAAWLPRENSLIDVRF